MIIKLHHPDGTEMDIESNEIVEMFENHTKEKSYTAVYLEEHVIVCVETIDEIQTMMGEKYGEELQ